MKNVHLTMATSGVARLRLRDNQVCGGVNKHRFFCWCEMDFLRSFASDATRKLDVFRHDCHTLSVDSGQVGVFEKAH